MNLNALPMLEKYDEIGTNEFFMSNSGAALSDTRQKIGVLRDTRPIPLNPEYNFTPKEIAEITQSLIEIERGNVKSTYDTEVLFADLEGR